MALLENLVVKMTGDSTGLVKATSMATRSLAGLGKTAGKLALGVGVAGGALFGAAAAGAGLLARQSAKSVDETRKLAVNLGTTANEAQALKLTFGLLGVSANDGIKTFQRLQRSLGDSELQTKANTKALEELGISQQDLAGTSPVERFNLVTSALGKMTDVSARAQIAAQLFGRQWQELNVVFQDGGAELAKSQKLFTGLGLGLGTAGKEVEVMNDAMLRTTTIGAALRDKVFVAIAPKLADLATATQEFVVQLIEAAGGADQLTEIVVGRLADGARDLVGFLGGVARIGGIIVDVFSTVGKVFTWVGDLIGGVVAVATELLSGNFSGAFAVSKEVAGNAFGGGEGDDAAERELRKQTATLERIAANTFGAVLQ